MLPMRSMVRRAIACGSAVLLAGLATPAGAAVDEMEPNDAVGSANDVSGGLDLSDVNLPSGAGVMVLGDLAAGDVDYFSFGVAAGEFVTVSAFDASRGGFHDASVALLDPTNTEVARDDDSGEGLMPSLGYLAAQAGIWKVALSGFKDGAFDGTHVEDFEYRLVISVTSDPANFPEGSGANDTPANAEALPMGAGTFEDRAPGSVGVASGSVTPGDVDYYAVPVEGGSRLAISVFDKDGGAFDDPVVRLFDATGTAQATDDDSGPRFVSSLSAAVDPASAPWTVAVSGFKDTGFDGTHEEEFDYELVVSLASAVGGLFCDVNGDNFVDSDDVDIIFDARGTPASGPNDPRDADMDGQITVLDSRTCTLECGNPNCAPSGGGGAGGGGSSASCGLAGLEGLALMCGALAWRRRRTSRRLEMAR